MMAFFRWIGRGFSYCRLAMVACWQAGLTKPGLALFAAAVSTIGAAVLTGLLGFALDALVLAKQWEPVSFLAYGLLFVIAMVIFSMHRLLAGKQALEAELWKIKFKMSNGEGDAEA